MSRGSCWVWISHTHRLRKKHTPGNTRASPTDRGLFYNTYTQCVHVTSQLARWLTLVPGRHRGRSFLKTTRIHALLWYIGDGPDGRMFETRHANMADVAAYFIQSWPTQGESPFQKNALVLRYLKRTVCLPFPSHARPLASWDVPLFLWGFLLFIFYHYY